MHTISINKKVISLGLAFIFTSLACVIGIMNGCDDGRWSYDGLPKRKEIRYIEFSDRQITLYLDLFLSDSDCHASLVIVRVDGSAYKWKSTVDKAQFDALWEVIIRAPSTRDGFAYMGPLQIGRTRFLEGTINGNSIVSCYLEGQDWVRRGGVLFHVSDNLLNIIGGLLKQQQQYEITARQLSLFQASILPRFEPDEAKRKRLYDCFDRQLTNQPPLELKSGRER
jgi:hypothetical protein